MKNCIAITLVCLVILVESVSGQEKKTTDFPSDFGQRAMDHVIALVRLGPRAAGSPKERDAAVYVRDQLEKLGLAVDVEPFEFETFTIKEAKLSVCEAEARPKMLGFNPYRGEFSFEGQPVFIPPDVGGGDLNKIPLADGFVITADPAPFFPLMFGKPRVIIYVEAEIYESLAAVSCPIARLLIDGEPARGWSANVVATIGSIDTLATEIVICAHHDSYPQSPGADDNASGIGVLIELARYFATHGVQSGVRLRFVAFGAEELGVLGSRCYLDAHREELARCALLVNIDQVGGPKGPYIEMTGGVSGIQGAKIENRFPDDVRNRAWEAMDGSWKIVDLRVVERFMVSNRPSWLTDLIAESGSAISCELIPTGNMGGDQQVFTQAGIVATSIGSSGNIYHKPEDTQGQVVVDQMRVAGWLVAEITTRLMEEHLGAKDNMR
jgi:hypothetical protein